jgi:peroxisomal 2,4-dienoyl-CoA reductase
MSRPSIFKDDVLAGKVAFVTGGGSGICYGITERLMQHGCVAAIVGRKTERLERAAKELTEKTGKECLPVTADVRDPAAVASALQQTLAKFGKLDVVVSGAAGNFLAPAATLSPNGFRTVMEIDAAGTFNVARAAFDAWLRDHGGVLIHISATLHLTATPLQIHASAAKAAIDSMTRSFALEWASLGIRVNGIAPGPIDDTEGMSRLAPGDVKERILKTIPIGRFGTIGEIADIALFLSTDAASLIHGETIIADGGAWFGGGRALG